MRIFKWSKTFILFLLCFSAQGQSFIGFNAKAVDIQKEMESLLISMPASEVYKKHLEALTKEPHLAGSVANKKVADYISKTMLEAGLQVERPPYDIFLPLNAGKVSLEIVLPYRKPLNIKENIEQEDAFSANTSINHGWNSFSGNGDVIAEVVYVNYGTKEDFEKLAGMGISVKGKIVLARYGGNFRGYKTKYAEANGAVGCIIFTDPEDSGYMRGLVYPEGTFYSPSTIQRGSLLTLDYTGDPLTPFEPALPLTGNNKVNRLKPEEVKDLHTIPTTPIGYESAQEILKLMKGKPVPEAWQGGLPFTYRLEGGSDLKVRLMVDQPKGIVRIEDVIGTLEGTEFPDDWIILGCHYDAWEFGASDPNSGTAMLLTLSEILGDMAKKGLKPKRTIKIAHWDAEEHGILGSTEWVEQYRSELSKNAVAYFNADAACSGLSFGGSSSPSLKSLMLNATKSVPYGDLKETIYEKWMAASGNPVTPPIGNLGGGSDHLPFYAHVGIPSLSAGMGGPTLYHSGYDDFHWYMKFGDPGLVSGVTITRLMGVMAYRLANATILPLDPAQYGKDLNTHLENVQKEIRKFSPTYTVSKLKLITDEITKNGELFLKLRDQALLKSLNTASLLAINSRIKWLERAFIDEKGMDYGAWYKSLYASSDPYSGYASWMLPGFMYLASNKESEKITAWENRYAKAFLQLNEEIKIINELLKKVK
jgi:N-acetylated-alpha-linked acidic dipeptidase